MSTTTGYAIVSGSFTQVSTGSASVTVQGTGNQPFEVFVGSAAPSPNSPASAGQIVGANDGYAWQGASLAGTDNVYVRAVNPAGGNVRVIAS